MTQADSIFGAEPERVKKLLAFGAEADEVYSEEHTYSRASVGALMEKPSTLIGRYRLIHVLGEGGMGIVYLAQQQEPVKREVALKVIKPGMDSKCVIARFEAEQQALALMEHPHIARVHDAGLTPSGRPYFVMEYVKGIPITEYCDSKRLTIEQRLRLFLHVCEAVQYAHQKGLIHRDIKPSNILVTVEDGEAVPKVIDFGVARAISQPLTERTLYTEQGQLIGTPEYMSPEQADPSNHDIDTRSDVYSLGVVLYELIAGILPFDPQTIREHGIEGARKIICEEDPQIPSTALSRRSIEESTNFAQNRKTNPRQLQRRLRGDLDWIILKAIEKDLTRRYASIGDLAADILRHLNDEPVTAGRPNLVYKMGKFVRRNRAVVIGLVAVLIVLLVGIVVSLVFAIRANRARREATVIAEFLHEDVFEAFDGWDRGGKQITIKEFLDSASEKVSEKFGDIPLQEASIRKTLGDLYLKVDVNNFTAAEDHLKRSMEIFTHLVGRNDARTIEVVDLLGQMYWHRWQYQDAEKYLSEALPSKRRLLGADHPETLETMAWLGWACYGNGHAKKAEEILTEAYITALRTLGEKDRITVECMLYYGCALILRGRDAKAEHMLADASRLARGILNPEHPFLLYSTALLGRLYSRNGRYQEAEKLLSNALTVSREAWGENNGGTFHNMAALAENYARQGLIDDAERLMLDFVGAGEESVESPLEISVQALSYLSLFYLWRNEYKDAEYWAGKALQESIDTFGEGHSITFLPGMSLGMVYQQQGRYEEAEMQFTRFLSILESKGKDENVHIANIMHQLATLYQQQDRYFEAERFHLKTLKFRRNLLVKNHPHTLGTIRGLITLYTSWGKPQEAQKWFAELKTAYANQSATYQNTSLEGATDYDSATKNYTLTAIPFIPCMTEKEINFSYPESTSEMWHIHDELHFAHKTLNGDGSITARIESIDQTHWQTKVGVMIRNTLEPISENAVIFITPLGEIVFEYRAKQLEATRSIFSDVKNSTQTCFIRLTRKGNQFTAQHSIDRINWHTIHDENSNQTSSIEIPMKETVYIGLAITSDNTYSTTEAKISNITVTGNVSPNGPFTVSEDISLYSVTLEKN